MHFDARAGWTSWYDAVQRLQRQTAQLEAESAELRAQLARLTERVETLEGRPAWRIDKIEYRFDQLKVEKLDGTLHIGMPLPGGAELPADTQSLAGSWPPADDSAETQSSTTAGFGGPASAGQSQPSPDFGEAMDTVSRYLDEQAPAILTAIERQTGVTLDPHHRTMVLKDLRAQVPSRLHYYLQPSERSGKRPDGAPAAAARTIADLEAAMRGYAGRLKGDGAIEA